jgi:hypothetical protein
VDVQLPTTWDGALRAFVGGTLVFALGFEGVTMLLGGKFLLAGASVVLALILLAIVVYWPPLSGTALVGIIVMTVVFLGTVEFCKRRKVKKQMLVIFGVGAAVLGIVCAVVGGALLFVARSLPNEAVAETSLPADQTKIESLQRDIEALKHDRDVAIQQRDAAIQQRDVANHQPLAPPKLTAPKEQASTESLSAEDIATKIDIWRSVNNQMNDFARALNQGYAVIDGLSNRIRNDKIGYQSDIIKFRDAYQTSINSLNSLRDAYSGYSDVYEALDPNVHVKLSRSIMGFYSAIESLSTPVPDNYENSIRPYTGALKRDLDAIRDWQSALRQTATSKGAELSKMGSN